MWTACASALNVIFAQAVQVLTSSWNVNRPSPEISKDLMESPTAALLLATTASGEQSAENVGGIHEPSKVFPPVGFQSDTE